MSAADIRKNCCSLSGDSSDRKPLKRFSSLPSLATQWTCIRCLLDNNCSSLICAACDASASIAQNDGKQIGARKSKKINLHKENRLKITSGLLANVLDGSVSKSDSGNNVKINNTGEYTLHKTIIVEIVIKYSKSLKFVSSKFFRHGTVDEHKSKRQRKRTS